MANFRLDQPASAQKAVNKASVTVKNSSGGTTIKSKAKIPDLDTLVQAGIDPKTGLPLKAGGPNNSWRKEAVKMALRVMDEQDAVNRYRWYNLPCNITSQELERLLYYKGQLCFFYCEPLDQFFFMPYALDGTIDFYGRFNRIHPVPMANGTSEAEKAEYKRQLDYLSTLKLNVLYDFPDELTLDTFKNSCVLLHDYTKQLSQTIVPRQQIQDPILDIMADCVPFMRTALLSGTGIQGMRVNSQDEESNVKAASRSVDRAALNGEKWIPIIGNIDFQDMTGGEIMKGEEYMMAMQSLDNFRLSLYGLDSGGLFQKNSHMLQAEQDMNTGNSGIIMDDGLAIRQNFCDLINYVWGCGTSCEIAEPVMGLDTNMDGKIATDNDQSGMAGGEQDATTGGDSDYDV